MYYRTFVSCVKELNKQFHSIYLWFKAKKALNYATYDRLIMHHEHFEKIKLLKYFKFQYSTSLYFQSANGKYI